MRICVVGTGYVGLVAAYAGVQITALLTIAVMLFNRRDVG